MTIFIATVTGFAIAVLIFGGLLGAAIVLATGGYDE